MLRRRTLVASDSYLDEYLTFVAEESGTFKTNYAGFSYSLDNGSTWTALAANTNTPTVSAGSRIMWKCNTTPPTDYSGDFSSTGKFEVQGNVMSLVYGDNFRGKTTLTVSIRFLFGDCNKLTKADKLKLPATTLAPYCYYSMFYGCSSLTTAPELPATTLATQCYRAMFNNCTSLTTAPKLPATTLAPYCYREMFSGCSSLTTAPKLPSTTLEVGCYQYMFNNCTSLTTAPKLPSTTLVSSCYYYMFYGCSSLTTAPELPATTLVSSCYYYMFCLCSSLNYIKVAAESRSSNNDTLAWLASVASSGTFYKNATAPASMWSTNDPSGIPRGWTVRTYTP